MSNDATAKQPAGDSAATKSIVKTVATAVVLGTNPAIVAAKVLLAPSRTGCGAGETCAK